MGLSTPAPVKPGPPTEKSRNGFEPPHRNGVGGNGHDSDGHGGTGWPGEAPQPDGAPRRRRSLWPFVLDLGLALALFGLVITGRFLIVIGAVLFVVALAGWIREARSEYSHLQE